MISLALPKQQSRQIRNMREPVHRYPASGWDDRGMTTVTDPEPFDPAEFVGLKRREYADTEVGLGPLRGCCSFCAERAVWMAFRETPTRSRSVAAALCERHARTKWWVR